MKKQTLLLMTGLIFPAISYGQVGINTTTPKATLDITAKNSSGVSTLADGLLIPRIDRQRALNMVSVVPSTLIYVDDISTGSATGQAANIDTVGFYYFDGPTNRWTKLTTEGNDTNIYTSDGTLAGARIVNTNGNNLSFSGTGNVGIGTTTASQKLDVVGTVKSSKAVVGDTWTGAALNVKNNIEAEPILTLVGSDGKFKARVTDTGNLGIGTTSPSEKLDVDGNVRFRGVPDGSPLATDRVIVVGSDGTAKKIPTSNLNNIGDVKYGFQTADHNGWFLLNGRSISSLPVANQSAAKSLFTNNLPNATERLLKPKGALGSTGGNSAPTSVTIAQANLPKVTLTGTTSSTGSHSHGLGSGNNRVYTGTGSSYVTGGPNTTGIAATNTPHTILSNTNSAGAHTHTVSMDLNNATTQTPLSINTENSYLSVNVFIYLGQ